ncbi:MAG: Xaa-Pro peptidase family protein [Thermodesulfobacteriota bacterium]|nr:MAG: Xaa-Pro peptidase family protein [Thermodesulfobacteriota bacterium]
MREKYVPQAEIDFRIRRLQKSLVREQIEAVLIVYKMDYFYFSGQAQDSILFVPAEGKPLLLVFRDIDRAKKESPLEQVVPLAAMGDLYKVIKNFYGSLPRRIGLELDVVPVRDYFRFQELLLRPEIVDSAKIIRQLRMCKSPFEIAQMRRAGEIGNKVHEEGLNILKEGMTEIEFGGHLELVAKQLEHEGLIRVRSLNYEAYSWHILSGTSGSIVSQANSPMGGAGLSPAFPVGAGIKKIKAHEPILVDFGVCYNGYLVDFTRMYSIGTLPDKYVKAYEASRTIERAVLEEARPGADCGEIYEKTVILAAKLGYEEYYLGIPEKKAFFVAHGVGLEINEIPFLASGQHYALEEGTTIAIEPKMVFPEEAGVGIENTVLITKQGVEKLTTSSEEIFQV